MLFVAGDEDGARRREARKHGVRIGDLGVRNNQGGEVGKRHCDFVPAFAPMDVRSVVLPSALCSGGPERSGQAVLAAVGPHPFPLCGITLSLGERAGS
jgi:hypothetical protein